MRVNLTVLRISTLFIHEPKRPLWAYLIRQRLGMNVGKLMDALQRMERSGWLTSEHEPHYNRALVSRPQRRLYRITDKGVAETKAVLADLRLPPDPRPKRPRRSRVTLAA